MISFSRSWCARPAWRRRCVAAATVAATAWAGAAQAQPAGAVALRWTAPRPCPDADRVRARLRGLLGAASAGPSTSDALTADGIVKILNGRYQLTLHVRREHDALETTRVFAADSCDSLAGAAAVTLALLARAGRSSATSPLDAPSSDSGEPSSASTASAAPPAPSNPAPAARAPAAEGASLAERVDPRARESPPAGRGARAWSVALTGPVLTIDEGMLPTTGFGVGAGAGVRLRRVEMTLSGALWLPQSGGAPMPYNATYTRRSGALSGCYRAPFGAFEAGPCLALALEDVTASGAGPQVVAGPGHATWLTIRAGVRAGWTPSGWTTFFVHPSLTLTTSRPMFAIDGVGPVYQVPLVTAGLDVGCEWIL